tara:strand:+ start:1221 stop:1967 length:747 start_codon:yes stop_codon:yes gene_type:complete
MLKKRIIISLTFLDGVLFRTKNFKPDHRYTKNFIDLLSIDELIIIDISKKKFSSKFIDIIKFFSNNCFVPLSVGGGINSLRDADIYFKNGADKIVLNANPSKEKGTLKFISEKYGNQSIIQSLDCKKVGLNKSEYTVMINSGMQDSNVDPLVYAKNALLDGAGEILINSIDNDGGLLGYDLDLIKRISKDVNCPLIALGGGGNWQHMLDLFNITNISAACTQNIFHFTEQSILSAKKFLKFNQIKIRN